MKIRQARPTDAQHIAPLVYQAIHDIAYSLTGTTDQALMLERLTMWIQQPNNRLSHENIWVAVLEDEVAGVLIAYPGRDALALDRPIQEWLVSHGLDGHLDVETEGDVFYLDSISVDSRFGGRGIATQLIEFCLAYAREQHIPAVTLNVDQTNPGAARLYERLGFLKQMERDISGDRFDYMKRDV